MASVAHNARQSTCDPNPNPETTYIMTGAVMMVHIYILTRECSLVWGFLGVNDGRKKKHYKNNPPPVNQDNVRVSFSIKNRTMQKSVSLLV